MTFYNHDESITIQKTIIYIWDDFYAQKEIHRIAKSLVPWFDVLAKKILK